MAVRLRSRGGTSAEVLVLTDPAYVVEVLRSEGATGRLAELRAQLERVVKRFDEKAIVRNCHAPDCMGRSMIGRQHGEDHATLARVPRGRVRPTWWCGDCNFTEFGSSDESEVIVTFADAVRYVQQFCGGRAQALRSLVGALARAKGLPARAGEAEIVAFFH
jgi:hypothetical protein